MKLFKKVFAIVMCVAVLASVASMGASVSADEAKTVVEAVRWFPADADRQNDEIWEVECLKEGCGCQRFTDVPEETGNTNFLDTEYTAEGGLKITRNGADATEGDFYWPRIRTLWLETYPELDIKTANTLYFDIVAENASWNFYMTFNGMNVKLGRYMAESTGVTVDGTLGSDDDAPAGTYTGSINLIDALTAISNSGDANATAATSVLNMKKTFVPQVQIFCVGNTGASVTINKLYLTTADDAEGAKTEHVDMGMIMGDIVYEDVDTDEPATDDGDTDADADTDADTDADADADKDDEATTTTKKPADKDDKDDKKDDAEGGSNTGLIVGIIIAAVVVVAVVVVVVLKKKKA